MATFDRRRIQGPEVSYAPIYEDEPEAGPSTRVDRANDEARPICELCIGSPPREPSILNAHSPQNRLDQPSEWQWLHRSGRRQDSLFGVRPVTEGCDGQTDRAGMDHVRGNRHTPHRAR